MDIYLTGQIGHTAACLGSKYKHIYLHLGMVRNKMSWVLTLSKGTWVNIIITLLTCLWKSEMLKLELLTCSNYNYKFLRFGQFTNNTGEKCSHKPLQSLLCVPHVHSWRPLVCRAFFLNNIMITILIYSVLFVMFG